MRSLDVTSSKIIDSGEESCDNDLGFDVSRLEPDWLIMLLASAQSGLSTFTNFTRVKTGLHLDHCPLQRRRIACHVTSPPLSRSLVVYHCIKPPSPQAMPDPSPPASLHMFITVAHFNIVTLCEQSRYHVIIITAMT